MLARRSSTRQDPRVRYAVAVPLPLAFVCPTAWDRRQLAACRPAWEGRVAPRFVGPEDDQVPADLDLLDLVERAAHEAGLGGAGALAGVTSSSDYPGAVGAALLARRLGLAGPDPVAVLAAGHKWLARQRQREVVPEATPWVALLDPLDPGAWPDDLAFPCFVKPVRGSFSVLARAVPDRSALEAFLRHADVAAHGRSYVAIHRALQRALLPSAPDPRCFLAEGLLTGQQVTVEGWVQGGRVHVLGVVDSILHPGTHAFLRFETPSALPPASQERLLDVVRRVVVGSGLNGTLFNVEAVVAPSGAAQVIELNPRLCGQFGDLWQKTTGVNGVERAIALALGEPPAPPRSTGSFPYAASVPLRLFEPARVLRAPSPERIAEVERAFPGTLIWWECSEGEVLEGFDRAGEGQGYRYAVLNVGASTRAGLAERARAVQQALGARFAPLAGR